MTVGCPSAPAARSLGIGLDLPWAGEVGFTRRPDGSEGPTDRLARFLAGPVARGAGHLFVSLQARDRARPRWADYQPAWDALFAALPPGPRGLHHTALSLGSLVPIDRDATLAMTAALIERHGLAWVNEDLGFWSLDGKPLPYPLPPVLDRRALAPAARAVRACQRALPAPLVLEFPGFTDDGSVTLGAMHAYDFVRALAEATDAPVTLDVGHLLSYQWLRGRRGEALFDELHRLPLAHAFELHLAGSAIVDGHFVDAHHGALLDAQLELAARLVERCPALRAVTFEDPVIDADGGLDPVSAASLDRLRLRLAGWLAGAGAASPPLTLPSLGSLVGDDHRGGGADLDRDVVDLAPVERALAAEVAGRPPPALPDALAALAVPTAGSFASVRRLWRGRMLGRVHRGLGTLADRFPATFAAWRAARPAADDDALAAELLAADEALAWREGLTAGDGASIEETFAAFADRLALGDAVTREDEAAGAMVRALALTPDPAFRVPAWVRRRRAGHLVVTRRGPAVLHAAIGGRYLRGPVTPLLVDLLDDVAAATIAAGRGLSLAAVARAEDELTRLGLGRGP